MTLLCPSLPGATPVPTPCQGRPACLPAVAVVAPPVHPWVQDTVRTYKLSRLRAEFFLNTCDLPMSFDSSMGRERGGYPVFSTEWVRGSIDILYPDPLDLSEDYYASERGRPRREEQGAVGCLHP